MSTTTYFRRPIKAEAMRVTEKNMEEVARWCGGEVISAASAMGLFVLFVGSKGFNKCVWAPTKDRGVSAGPGQWLVREETDGVYFVMDHDQFTKYYQNEPRAMAEDFWESRRSETKNTFLESIGRRVQKNYDFSRVVVTECGEAEAVIDSLHETLSKHGVVTVADLYQIVGVTPIDEDHRWGWKDIRGVDATRVDAGYLINLPKPTDIQKDRK